MASAWHSGGNEQRLEMANWHFPIIDFGAPIAISNLAVVCKSCDRPARVGFRLLEDARKVRYCKHCNEAID